MDKLLSTQWILIVIGGFAMIFITLMLTHRIAGPFFRYEKTLNEMIARNLAYQIFLRKTDEGKELGNQINAFNQMLSSDLHQLTNNCQKIDQWCKINDSEEYLQAPESNRDALKNKLDKINRFNQKSLSILNDYKLL